MIKAISRMSTHYILFDIKHQLFQFINLHHIEKVQVGNDQEKAQLERSSHSKKPR